MTRIIIDSTSDFPEHLSKRLGFSVLPLSVIIDDAAYRDGVEIQLDDVYGAIRAGKIPSTAQIRWDDTMALFSSIAQAGDDFIYLAFSSAMSGTYDLANMVCSELRVQNPSCRMAVVDSRGGSMGTGLIALQLGLMNEDGVSFDEMVSQCEWMASHVKYAFTISDLKCALRGGRLLARAAGNIGSVLNIKPLMVMKDGKLHLDKLIRGTKQSLGAIADSIVSSVCDFDKQIIGITHADDQEKADIVKALLQARLPDCTFLSERIGGVLGVHLGIGGVGVYCMDKKPERYYLLG